MGRRFLTLQDLLDAHELAIDEYGGGEGLREIRTVEAIVGNAASAADYGDDAFEIAACYVLYINPRHPWNDGNKRVSAMACARFLSWNGVPTGHSTKHLEQRILSVATATNQASREQIARHLRQIFG